MGSVTVISLCVVSEIAYMVVRGRLVAGCEVAAFRETLTQAGPNLALLVVNLRDLDKIDAAGLSALLFAQSTAESLGARFRLAAVPPKINEVLSAAKLDRVLSTSPAPIPR